MKLQDTDVPDTPMVKALRALARDLDAEGWERPTRVYATLGTEDDPYFALGCEAAMHPAELMEHMYTEGGVPGDDDLGAVLVTENYAYKDYNSMARRDPTFVAKVDELLKAAERDGRKLLAAFQESEQFKALSEEAQAIFKEANNNEVSPEDFWTGYAQNVPPHMSDPSLRLETRMFIAVDRAGEPIVAIDHVRGEEVADVWIEIDKRPQGELAWFIGALSYWLRGLNPANWKVDQEMRRAMNAANKAWGAR